MFTRRSLVLLTVLLGATPPSLSAQPIRFTATLAGANENPPVASSGTGTGVVTLDPVSHTMRVQVTFAGLSGTTTAAISLVEMYRTLGQREEALAAARRVASAVPGDALYALDLAELALESGQVDEAAEAFMRLRELVDVAEDGLEDQEREDDDADDGVVCMDLWGEGH